MKAEIKAKWVAALRSGDYTQTRGKLIKYPEGSKNGPPRHCCLGVLADVSGIKVNPDAHDIFDFPCASSALMIPVPYVTNVLAANHAHLCTCGELNDNEGKSFDQIADWIEENMEDT